MTLAMSSKEFREKYGKCSSWKDLRKGPRQMPVSPRPKQNPGRMNKTEALYQDRVLEILRQEGRVLRHVFEGIKLRLADKTFYTPDFMVVYPDRIELHEVKGHWEDDARVKIKVAAQQFPEFAFVAVQRKRGEWKYECF